VSGADAIAVAVAFAILVGVLLVVLLVRRARATHATSLVETAERIGAELGLEVTDPGERLRGERGEWVVQVLWSYRARGGGGARPVTVAWAAVDPPLELEIVLSTPHRAAGPGQARIAEWGEPPAYLGGRDAGRARRPLGDLRAQLRAAASPIGGHPPSDRAHDVDLEIDKRSVQLVIAGHATSADALREALERAVAVARAVSCMKEPVPR